MDPLALFLKVDSELDAHGHLLEHGFKRQLELDNCGSSEGSLSSQDL